VRTVTLSAAETPTGFTRSNACENYFPNWPIFGFLGNQLNFAQRICERAKACDSIEIATTIAGAVLSTR
jgi:hypothetical protein